MIAVLPRRYISLPQDGDETLGLPLDTKFKVCSHRICKVDIHPVAGLVLKTHRYVRGRIYPLAEEVAELASLIAIGVQCLAFS